MRRGKGIEDIRSAAGVSESAAFFARAVGWRRILQPAPSENGTG